MTPGARATDLLEREAELARLARHLEGCARDGGALALVAGEAGIGKSALVRSFLAQHARGPRVLAGACEALFTPRALGPLYDVAWNRAGELARHLAEGAPRPALFAAALAELAAEPSVLVLEDVHWADEATLDFLKFLARRIHATRALALVTYRDDELGPAHPLHSVLGDLPRERVLRIALAPLSRAGVGRLARAAGRAQGASEREELFRITGGNPFFVSEVLAADTPGVPATVREAVLARAARLSAAARATLDRAALFPGRVERALFVTLTGAAAGLEECLASGLLLGEPGGLAFRHELARRALEAALEPGLRAEEHARILAALEAAGGDPARLAYHAGEAHDAAAVLRLAPLAAGRAATVGAHREAAAHYRAALAHAERLEPAARAELCELRSYECYLTDAIPEALEARLEALALWRALGRPEREGDCLRWASRLEWFLGRKAEADRHAREAFARLEPLGPTRALAMACSNRAQLAMLEDDTDEAVEWGERALARARAARARPPDLEVRVHALNNLGTARWRLDPARGRRELEQSLALAREHGLEEHVARAWTNLGTRCVMTRDYAAARGYLLDGIEYARERDLDAWTLYMRAWLARLELELGHLDAAAREAEAVLARAHAAPISRIPALVVLGRLRARRGDPGAEAVLAEAYALARPTGEAQRIVPVAFARAEAAWLTGDDEACAAAAREGLACTRLDGWARGELVLWLARAGRAPEAEPGAAGEHAEPFASELAGEAERAAELWEALGCPYERALALASGGEPAQRAALELLRALGAEPAARLVARALREKGVRGIPRGERASTRANPGGLTARELEVLAFVDQGLRNADIARRLFVSAKTVEHHVTAILAKLGVSSRARAAARARESGWLAPPRA